jgi:hypothetical protein
MSTLIQFINSTGVQKMKINTKYIYTVTIFHKVTKEQVLGTIQFDSTTILSNQQASQKGIDLFLTWNPITAPSEVGKTKVSYFEENTVAE